MKKIFTLLAGCAASMAMWAGNFQLYFGDTPVTDGATYTTRYELEAEENFNGKVYYTWIQDANLFLHGTPGTSVTMEVSSEQTVQVCSLDGNCSILNVPPFGSSVTKTGTIKTNGESAEIHQTTETVGDEDPASIMENIVITVVAYETSAPDNKVTVTVNMTNESAGIASVSQTETFIKSAAGNVLKYRVDAPATLQIFAITGNLVAKYPISNSGSINLSAMPKGIYIYTDGTHKGKIIVK